MIVVINFKAREALREDITIPDGTPPEEATRRVIESLAEAFTIWLNDIELTITTLAEDDE